MAYGVGCGESERIVLDGVPGPAYSLVNAPTFSPDGRRFAYAASDDRGSWVVLDGVEGPRRFSFRRWLAFSDDGLHFAYVASGERRPQPEWAVLDGVPGPSCDLIYSPFRLTAHGELIYVAQRAGALWRVEQTLPAGRRERGDWRSRG